jgi:hypothetical protein
VARLSEPGAGINHTTLAAINTRSGQPNQIAVNQTIRKVESLPTHRELG